jgi:acetyl-CoA C-acetyltransferase
MAALLRDGRGRHGLVSSVSGVLTKQGFGLWSREPGRNGFALRDVSDDVARAVQTKPIVESASGAGAIAGYTVIYERGQPPRGVAVVDVDAGRAVVQTEDPALIASMESEELCGTRVRLGDDHTFAIAP